VEKIGGVRYDKIDADGNLHITLDGERRVLEVDSIVVCAGQVERRDLEAAAAAAAAQAGDDASNGDSLKERVYTIGGAYEAGELDAKRAIDMGTRLALRIHDPDVKPGQHVFRAEPGIEESMFHLLKRFM